MSQVFLRVAYRFTRLSGVLKDDPIPLPLKFAAMDRKLHLKERYSDIPPVPFTAFDYVLCAVAFLLTGIASNALIANLLISIYRSSR